jgi:hypothetical protein
MAVVVRCTDCRGVSQVELDVLGLLVKCPRCHAPFIAIEDATPILKTPVTPVRPLPGEPLRRPRRRTNLAEPVREHVSPNPLDGPLPDAGPVPVSVLIGLALLPLAIPLLWLIGPHLLAKPASLTLAAPASLAIAASSLCLAVVFTVDWTPLTRIKGVLILVGLSYFAGLSLYFLKKDLIERVRDFFTPTDRWQEYREANGAYTVMTPGNPMEYSGQPLAGWKLKCRHASSSPFPGPSAHYVYGAGPDAKAQSPDWFAEVDRGLSEEARNAEQQPPTDVMMWNNIPAKQWIMEMANDRVRVVRVFRSAGTVYYLSVESEDLEPDSPMIVGRFFDSFRINAAAPPGKREQ